MQSCQYIRKGKNYSMKNSPWKSCYSDENDIILNNNSIQSGTKISGQVVDVDINEDQSN